MGRGRFVAEFLCRRAPLTDEALNFFPILELLDLQSVVLGVEAKN
jgi:hypothetical protein